MGKNRDSLTIIADILRFANSGTNKTKIMYSANLSFKVLEKYLNIVMSSGLLKKEKSLYILTPLGCEFIKKYGDYQDKYNNTLKAFETLDCEKKRLSHFYEDGN